MSKSKFAAVLEQERDEETPPPKPKRKPKAKRNDPKYAQVTAYIPKAQHEKVKIELIKEAKEFSTLVEELLGEWLKSR